MGTGTGVYTVSTNALVVLEYYSVLYKGTGVRQQNGETPDVQPDGFDRFLLGLARFPAKNHVCLSLTFSQFLICSTSPFGIDFKAR
jgi:hypothetical protein